MKMANDLYNAGRALGQGVMFGFSDEAEAKARAERSGRPYDEELANIRREYAQFGEEYPIAQPALEFVGGALPAIAGMLIPGGQVSAPASVARLLGPLSRVGAEVARQPGVRNVVGGLSRTADVLGDITGYGKTVSQRSLAENIGRGAVTGGVQGALSGAGASEGSRAAGALIGGVLGAGLGPAAVAVPALIGSAGRWMGQYASPSLQAIEDAAARRMSRSMGMTPEEMQTSITEAASMGVPAMPMNVSRGATGQADILAQRPGESQRVIGEGISQQREGARDRLIDQVRSNLSPAGYYSTRDAVQQELRDNARDAYRAAYDFGAVDDPVIMDLLRVPQFKAAFQRAQSIANLEQAGAKARGEDPSQFALERVYRSTGQFDPAAVDALRQMGIPEDKIGSYLTQAGDSAMQMEEVAIPDVRTLDYIKRGLDSLIDQGFRGEGMSTAEAKALRELRNTFVDRIDTVVPEYADARRIYSGDLEVLDALDSGYENFAKMDPEEISMAWGGYSDAEKAAFRTGAARNLWSVVMNPSAEADYAKRIIGSPATRQKLQAIFPSDAAYKLFEAAMQRESQLFKDASTVLAGSATARRQAGMEAFEADPLLDAASVLATQGFEGGLINGVLNMFSKGRVSDSVATKMAEWLTADDPQKVAAVVDALNAFATRQAPTVTRRTGYSAGVSGGTLGAGFPAPEEQQE
jgi:hypothetical protein